MTLEATQLDQVRAEVSDRGLPLASAASAERLEAALGFPLPELLRRLYLEVADGGWGPDYGVLGIDRGHTDEHGRRAPQVLEQWRTIRERDWRLPASWFPLLHAGCGMHFWVDCATRAGSVRPLDPNPGLDAYPEHCVIWQTKSIDDFVTLWLSGKFDDTVYGPP